MGKVKTQKGRRATPLGTPGGSLALSGSTLKAGCSSSQSGGIPTPFGKPVGFSQPGGTLKVVSNSSKSGSTLREGALCTALRSPAAFLPPLEQLTVLSTTKTIFRIHIFFLHHVQGPLCFCTTYILMFQHHCTYHPIIFHVSPPPFFSTEPTYFHRIN